MYLIIRSIDIYIRSRYGITHMITLANCFVSPGHYLCNPIRGDLTPSYKREKRFEINKKYTTIQPHSDVFVIFLGLVDLYFSPVNVTKTNQTVKAWERAVQELGKENLDFCIFLGEGMSRTPPLPPRLSRCALAATATPPVSSFPGSALACESSKLCLTRTFIVN